MTSQAWDLRPHTDWQRIHSLVIRHKQSVTITGVCTEAFMREEKKQSLSHYYENRSTTFEKDAITIWKSPCICLRWMHFRSFPTSWAGWTHRFRPHLFQATRVFIPVTLTYRVSDGCSFWPKRHSIQAHCIKTHTHLFDRILFHMREKCECTLGIQCFFDKLFGSWTSLT